MRTLNPDTVVKPASSYAQAVIHSAAAERLVIAGQIGITPDGRVVPGLEGQMEQAWRNVLAVMAAAGFERTSLVRAVAYVTVPGQVALYRTVRERILGDHLAAMTYLEISGLASPDLLVEIEAEAVKE